MHGTLLSQFHAYAAITVSLVFLLLTVPAAYLPESPYMPGPVGQAVLISFVLFALFYVMRHRLIDPVCRLSETAAHIDDMIDEADMHVTGIAELDVLCGRLQQINHYVQDLHNAQQQADAASRAKSEFISHISHELRTPLNAIIGFSEVLGQEAYGHMNDKQKEYSEDICRSGHHLLELINDILDVARIENGQLELKEERVNMNDVLMDSVRDISHAARKKDVQVHVNLLRTVPALHGDRLRLRQICFNLLSNAVTFTPAGGHVLLQASEDRDGMTVRVRDTGIGMTKNELVLAQEKFGQVENVLSRSHGGAGLGLPLAKKLAILHGAEFTIESIKGVGTTVTMFFPGVTSKPSRKAPSAHYSSYSPIAGQMQYAVHI